MRAPRPEATRYMVAGSCGRVARWNRRRRRGGGGGWSNQELRKETATGRETSGRQRIELSHTRERCVCISSERGRACATGPFGPTNVAHIGPNLLVSVGPAGHHITREPRRRARGPCTPTWGEAITGSACWLHRLRCRWRGEGWATACGRTVAVRLARRLMPIAARSTVRRAIASQPRAGAEQVSCLVDCRLGIS